MPQILRFRTLLSIPSPTTRYAIAPPTVWRICPDGSALQSKPTASDPISIGTEIECVRDHIHHMRTTED
jgi:hypothetical protein